MDVNPLPPLLQTLTPITTLQNVPPDRPPDPSISILFPENTRYRVLNNPFRGPLSKGLKKAHKVSLSEALSSIRGPSLFAPDAPFNFDGESVGADTSTESFNAAVTTVIASIECGYYPTRDPTPLDASNWARLSCTLIAAIGRGYNRQYATDQEANLGKARAEAIDADPLSPDFPTLFHRLAATAEDVAQHIKPGQEGYQDWYAHIKKDFTTKATKAAAAEVDEKWLKWKANELDRLARTHDAEMAAEARKGGKKYFIAMASRLGLKCTAADSATGTNNPSPPITTAGKKRTASGSAPSTRLPTPAGIKANLIVETTSATHTDSPAATPRGRAAQTPSTSNRHRQRLNPSPMRVPTTPQTILRLSPRATLNLEVTKPRPPTVPTGPPGIDAITAAIQAAMGPAIQAAMAPYAAKLNALEKATMPPPPMTRPTHHHNPTTAVSPPTPPTRTVHVDSGFILIDRQSKKWKGRDGATGSTTAQPAQINLTPASYASTATGAASIQQPLPPCKQGKLNSTVTEVTII